MATNDLSTDAPYILETMPTIGQLPEVNEWVNEWNFRKQLIDGERFYTQHTED